MWPSSLRLVEERDVKAVVVLMMPSLMGFGEEMGLLRTLRDAQ